MRLTREPRWYQTAAVNAVFSYFQANGGKVDAGGNPLPANPVIALPTGTGKSLVNAMLAKAAIEVAPATRILMLVHVKELIEQNAAELLTLWPSAPVGIYSAGLRRYDTVNQIIFGGIGSVANNVEAFGWRDLVFIDECHMLSPAEGSRYQAVLDTLRKINPWLRVIGLSATPFRMGMGYITDNGIFTHICYDVSGIDGFKRLLDDGHLCPIIPKRTSFTLDVSSVHLTQGDYAPGELEKAVDKNDITFAAMREACQLGEDRRSWLVFTAGISHSENCAEMLRGFGVNAVAVHSKLKPKERDNRLEAFKAGRYTAICGNNIFTTGFNHPPVDFIVIVRPTKSVGLWVQILGRGTRPFAGNSIFPHKENCLVADFAANTAQLGPIDDPQIPKRRKPGNGDAPCCICEECGTYNHARAVICIACGAVITHELKIVAEASNRPLLSSDLPIHEWIPVQYMLSAPHYKNNAPPSLRVTFVCGLHRFNKWVMLEHTGYVGKAGRDWWRLFDNGGEPPVTVDEANKRFERLPVPKQIKVWVNTKYPEVVDYQF